MTAYFPWLCTLGWAQLGGSSTLPGVSWGGRFQRASSLRLLGLQLSWLEQGMTNTCAHVSTVARPLYRVTQDFKRQCPKRTDPRIQMFTKALCPAHLLPSHWPKHVSYVSNPGIYVRGRGLKVSGDHQCMDPPQPGKALNTAVNKLPWITQDEALLSVRKTP